MSAQVTISQLPTASALTGQELVPIVQSGVTVQTTTGAISGAGALNYPFLTVGTTAGLTQARYLSTSAGLSLSDTGAGGQLTINMTGPASSLNAAGTGIIVKNGASTVTSVQLAVGAGMTVANADGVAGNPTLGLSTILQNLSTTTASGLLTLNGTTIIASTIVGTTNQISITNGNGVGGSPTVGIANNPVLPGTASVTLPSGTTAQRGTPGIAQFRYNTDTGLLEFYSTNAWLTVATNTGGSAGVTSVGTGTGLTGGPITSTGTISIADTGVTAGTYTFPTIAVNAQGQITSASSGSGFLSSITFGTTGLTPSTPTSGAVTVAGTLITSNGGTGLSTYTAGDLLYYASGTTLTKLGIGTAGQVLSVNGGATAPQWTNLSSFGVTTFSGGTTGLTPNTATSGAITLAGTLSVANGGTGLNSLTANYIPYGNGTSAFSSSSLFTFNGTTLVSPALSLSLSALTSSSTSNFQIGGPLSFSDTGIANNIVGTTNSYLQSVLQNKSNGSSASAEYIVYNDQGTASTNFATMGINSSTYSGTGSINAPGYAYFLSASTDLVLGTIGANGIHFTVNSGATDAMAISSTGIVSLGTPLAVTSGGTGVTSSSGANSVVLRDANANITSNNLILGWASTATAAGTTTLTVSSAYQQRFTGTTTQTVVLPNATTLALGQTYVIINDSTGALALQDGSLASIGTITAGMSAHLVVKSIGTAAGTWEFNAFVPDSGPSGQVTWGTSGLSMGGQTITNLGQLTSIVTTGTAPFVVASTTPVANLSIGGNAATSTNLSGGAIGSLPYQSAANTTLFVSGNTTTTPQFLTSTGTGSAAQAPILTGSTGSGNVVLSTAPVISGIEMPNTISANYTITAGNNSTWVTPLSISSIVTIPSTSSWTLI